MSTTFAQATPMGPRASQAVKAKTRPAETRSPSLTKKPSMACLAWYFSLRLVGSQSICLPVFMTE